MEQTFFSGSAFSPLLESLPGMLYRYSTELNVLTYVSQGTMEITGYTAEEMLARPVTFYTDLIHPQDRERVEQTWHGLQTPGTMQLEYRIVSRNGSVRGVKEVFSKVYNEVGLCLYREGYITEVVINELYESIINNLNVDIAVFDENNNYQLINQIAVKDEEQRKWLIGKSDMDYFSRKGRDMQVAEERIRMLNLVDELDKPIEWMEEVVDNSGSKRYFVRTLKPFRNQLGKYKVGYGVDVTGLKVVQDELMRREHLLSFSHKLAGIGYWAYYPKTGKYEWSRGVYDIFEADERDFAPSMEAYFRFIHPADRQQARCRDKTRQVPAIPFTEEFRIITTQGQEKYIKEQVSSLHSDAGEYIFGVMQDITEIKLIEKERERLIEELNKKYNDLMQFSYIVSHNLRNPVANIIGMSYLFRMELSEEERQQAYDYICQSAEAIDTVIKDLNLVISSRSPLNESRENCSLSELLSQVCSTLENQIAEAGAIIDIDIADDADSLCTIRSYMHSIFHNLISNAVKYRDEGRQLHIRLSVSNKENCRLIEVSDNGIGIDLKAHGKQLFGLYKRFTTAREGKGLGLHMTKAQVESLGGSIHVESQPGIGTCFKIVLPA